MTAADRIIGKPDDFIIHRGGAGKSAEEIKAEQKAAAAKRRDGQQECECDGASQQEQARK